MFLNYLIMMLMLFLSIAYFTIMERKILSIFHFRKGPNKVGFQGIYQPFSDAIKLFSKNLNFLSKVNIILWNISPILLFFIIMMIFNFLPLFMENNKLLFNMMFLVFLIGLPIFSIMMSSIFSSNKFSNLGTKRCITQMLSYELGLMMIMIIICPISMKLNFEEISMFISKSIFLNLFFLIMFFVLILGESSRIPFDFIEGESELVSGFNIEFSSSYFSLFFIYEYGMMLFFSVISSFILLNFFYSFILIFLIIIIRSSFPRFRYDQMMEFFWNYFYTPTILIISFLKVY